MQLVMHLKDTITKLRLENSALSDAFCLLCNGTADWPTLLESLPQHVAARLPPAGPGLLSPPPSAPPPDSQRLVIPERPSSADTGHLLAAMGRNSDDTGLGDGLHGGSPPMSIAGITSAAATSQPAGAQAIAAIEAEFKVLLGSVSCAPSVLSMLSSLLCAASSTQLDVPDVRACTTSPVLACMGAIFVPAVCLLETCVAPQSRRRVTYPCSDAGSQDRQEPFGVANRLCRAARVQRPHLCCAGRPSIRRLSKRACSPMHAASWMPAELDAPGLDRRRCARSCRPGTLSVAMHRAWACRPSTATEAATPWRAPSRPPRPCCGRSRTCGLATMQR